MKNVKLLSVILALSSILFVSSCSNQVYSYREKVKVEPKTAQVKINESPKITSPATTSVGSTTLPEKENAIAGINPTAPTVTTEKAETQKVLKDIQQIVPQQSSKAFHVPGSKQLKSAKEQFKTMKKDIQTAQQGFAVDGMKWMVLGAILCIVAWLLSVVGLGGGVVAAVGSIGGLIFLIGFIFWLIDVLK